MTQQAQASTPVQDNTTRQVRRTLWANDWAIKAATPVGFVLIFVALQLVLDRGFFVAVPRVLNIHQNVPVLLLATAAVVGLLGGAFDLSIAGNATLSTFLVIGLTSQQGLPLPVVIILVLLFGAVVGTVNGIVVSTLGINVIIATLGMGSVLVGLSSAYSGGAVMSATGGSPLPDWFLEFGSFTTKLPFLAQAVVVILALVVLWIGLGKLNLADRLGRYWPVWRLAAVLVLGLVAYFVLDLAGWLTALSVLTGAYLVVVLMVWILMDRTMQGRAIKATGANPLAARLAGVKTGRETYRAFVVSGLLSATAGIAIAANQGSASPDVAGGFLLPAFAAAFLSTVIFSAGRFTVTGTAVGGIFIIWVAQGLIEGGLPFTWTGVVNGVVLIIAVGLSAALKRKVN